MIEKLPLIETREELVVTGGEGDIDNNVISMNQDDWQDAGVVAIRRLES